LGLSGDPLQAGLKSMGYIWVSDEAVGPRWFKFLTGRLSTIIIMILSTNLLKFPSSFKFFFGAALPKTL
jgi:hypothetical protein